MLLSFTKLLVCVNAKTTSQSFFTQSKVIINSKIYRRTYLYKARYMCSGSKSNFFPTDLKMESRNLPKSCSKLLESAATDDLPCFIHEVEQRGCDVDEFSFWYGRSFGSKKMGFEERSPIMIASLYGSIDVLNYVVKTGKVDVNRACGSDGATALHCAAAGGSWASVEIVKILIEAGGDINAVDGNGKKPGDLVAPCVKSSSNLKRKTLEMLNGIKIEGVEFEEGEGSKLVHVSEKKEYPIDVSLPDINDGLYGTDEFRMYSFKVKPCSRAYSHDWTDCPFVHPGENARRRDPRKYHYTCVPCPEFKKGSCAKGDTCEYAHGVFESWLHPAQYRTRLCKDETGCLRKVCFFAHKPEELRLLYASTGSAMPSPKSYTVNSMDMKTLSPLSLGSPSYTLPNGSNSPMSPPVTCSSPVSGNMWQNKVNITPPMLQLPGSRLKTSFNARDVELDMELLGLEKIRTQQKQRQQLDEEMASLSSPYGRVGDLNPTNLDDVFGSLDPSMLSKFQGLSPRFNNTMGSPTGPQIRQNMNQLRASYPSNVSSSPGRKPAYGFDSSAAVAQAVMNSRSSAFIQRSQSFIGRSAVGYRSDQRAVPSNHSQWGSPSGKLDWCFNGEDVNKLRKSASFGFCSGNGSGSAAMAPSNVDEPDLSWVNSMVKDVDVMPQWVDQLYIEQEQMVA